MQDFRDDQDLNAVLGPLTAAVRWRIELAGLRGMREEVHRIRAERGLEPRPAYVTVTLPLTAAKENDG